MIDTRDRIVAEAMTWLKTPWHHLQRCKGAGVDCLQFLAGVYSNVGLVAEVDTGYYSHDWHLHESDSLFLAGLLRHTVRAWKPRRGDVVMMKYGKHPAHGGIIVDWPVIVHAYAVERAVVVSDLATLPLLRRVSGFYCIKGLAE